MSPSVTVVDYGLGNLLSVRRAFEHCGGTVSISNDPEILLKADRLVLPGVGAFADGMSGLSKKYLDRAILEFSICGRPILGICLGMQLLGSVSHEFGVHAGLNLIPGRVIAIPPTAEEGRLRKIPFVGWTSLEIAPNATSWTNTVLSKIAQGDAVYAIHSYQFVPENFANRLAESNYDGLKICSAVVSNNISGLQFHPEKSGNVGLKILESFLTL